MSFSLLLSGLLGAACVVGMAVGIANLIDKLTLGTIKPRLVFSNHNDTNNADGVNGLVEQNAILKEENNNLYDEIYRLEEDNQVLEELLLSTRRASRDPSVSSYNEDSPLAPRAGRRRVESPSPRRRHHVDGDLGNRYRPTPTPTPTRTSTGTRSRLSTAGTVEPTTPLSVGRRAASKSPARHLGTPGAEPITKKEKLDAAAQRAAEWAKKRKEKKASYIDIDSTLA